MNDWKEASYGKTDEPFMRRLSYSQAQRLYELYCERLTFSRARSGPLRRKLPPEEKQRYMETVYRKDIARDEDTGKRMFLGVPPEYVDRFHGAREWYARCRERLKEIGPTLSEEWREDEVLAVAGECGAELTGFTTYRDPVYKKEMATLVFAIGMQEVNGLEVPSVAQYSMAFKKNFEIQEITNRIAERLWEKGIWCEPVPCATYYHLDNIEFNQVRFCQAAFSGGMGKNFLFTSEKLGSKFRMSQVLLALPRPRKFPKATPLDFCKGCTICVDACPSGALKLDNVVVCSRYFMTHDHCSICMAICPIGKS